MLIIHQNMGRQVAQSITTDLNQTKFLAKFEQRRLQCDESLSKKNCSSEIVTQCLTFPIVFY